eukprot:TRINITY_DN102716_c0_g1_i1.p1 TRINITY_DN102716_c0_g1~~TRINITY_DN102716_c0_g1_i1.p1  ORF type:complete len:600 (+),score=104.36 TRINITY_DN102716_c0_g1_i1:56-1855(+)
MKHAFLYFFILLVLENVFCYFGNPQHIAFLSIPLLDHVIPLKSLASELVLRGYRVTFAIFDEYQEWLEDAIGVEFVSAGPSPLDVMSEEFFWSGKDVYSTLIHHTHTLALFEKPMLLSLFSQYSSDRPDLLVVDRLSFAGFDLAQALNVSLVVNNPMLLLDLDDPPMYVPAPFSEIPYESPSIWYRFVNPFYRLRHRLTVHNAVRKINEVRHNVSLPIVHSKWDLYGTAVVLCDSTFHLDFPRPLPPNFHMVGPLVPRFPPPLDNFVERWLQNQGNNPILLINLSSVPLRKSQAAALLSVVNSVDISALWVLASHSQNLFPSQMTIPSRNLAMVPKLPESMVLKHPQVVLYITGGDLTATTEALTEGVPVIGVPFRPDQFETMWRIESEGAGLLLPFNFSSTDINTAVRTVMNSSQMHESTVRLGDALKSGGGTLRAADIVEATIKFGSEIPLYTQTMSIPWFQRHYLDVYSVLIACICLFSAFLKVSWTVLGSIFTPSVPRCIPVSQDIDSECDCDDPNCMGERHVDTSFPTDSSGNIATGATNMNDVEGGTTSTSGLSHRSAFFKPLQPGAKRFGRTRKGRKGHFREIAAHHFSTAK